MLLSDLADVQDDCRRLSCIGKRACQLDCDGGDLEPMHLWNHNELLRAEEYVRRYEQSTKRCGWWDLVCHLGDNPRTGWLCWSGSSNKIPTIRKSSGLFALPAAHRHLTVRELHGAMGFPVTPLLAGVSQVPVFDPWRNGLSHARSRQALGNSQVVPNVGVITVCLMACCRFKQQCDADMGLESV